MKTLSSRLRAAVAIAAAACFALFSTAARAAVPGEVFEQNREAILATNSVSAEGFVFCVGRAVSEDRLGAAVGFGKARALAWGQFDRYLFSSSEWPTNATPEECRAVWLRHRNQAISAEEVRGAEIVRESQPEPGRWLSVLAVPYAESVGLRPSPEALKKAIDDLRVARKRESGVDADPVPPDIDPITEPTAEPRGLWEQDGVLANETMSDGQF